MLTLKRSRKNYVRIALVLTAFCLCAGSHAEQGGLAESLGINVQILERGNDPEIAKLGIVSVDESRDQAFKSADRIAGYPIKKSVEIISTYSVKDFVSLILNPNSYTNIRQRCKNESLKGIRFAEDGSVVEMAIGEPCNQIVVAYKIENKTLWWGGTLHEDAAEQAKELFCPEARSHH